MGFRASVDVNRLKARIGIFFRLSVVYRLAVEARRWLSDSRLIAVRILPVIIDVVTRVVRLGLCIVI